MPNMIVTHKGSAIHSDDWHSMTSEDWVNESDGHLGNGISRDVYDLSENYVLKVMRKNIGWGYCHDNANEMEVDFYVNLPDDDKGPFAEIVAWSNDYSWVIMEKIEDIGDDYGLTSDDYEILKKYAVGDLHDGNFGCRSDGTFAVIDYAAVGIGFDGGCLNGFGTGHNCGFCGEHRCSDCNHGTCTCGTLYGNSDCSKRIECERCESLGLNALWLLGKNTLRWKNRARLATIEFDGHILANLNGLAAGRFQKASQKLNDRNLCGDCFDIELREDLKGGNDPRQEMLPFNNRFQIGVIVRVVQEWNPIRRNYSNEYIVRYYVRDMFGDMNDGFAYANFDAIEQAVKIANETHNIPTIENGGLRLARVGHNL